MDDEVKRKLESGDLRYEIIRSIMQPKLLKNMMKDSFAYSVEIAVRKAFQLASNAEAREMPYRDDEGQRILCTNEMLARDCFGHAEDRIVASAYAMIPRPYKAPREYPKGLKGRNQEWKDCADWARDNLERIDLNNVYLDENGWRVDWQKRVNMLLESGDVNLEVKTTDLTIGISGDSEKRFGLPTNLERNSHLSLEAYCMEVIKLVHVAYACLSPEWGLNEQKNHHPQIFAEDRAFLDAIERLDRMECLKAYPSCLLVEMHTERG